MKELLHNRENGLSKNTIQHFKKMFGYLQRHSESTEGSLYELLSLRQHLKDQGEENPDEKASQILKQKRQNQLENKEYKQTNDLMNASIVAGDFGLQVTPLARIERGGTGISVINGKKLIEFLSNISLHDLEDHSLKEALRLILVHIDQIYGQGLEYNIENACIYDNFDELTQYRGEIKTQYKRLGYGKEYTLPFIQTYVDAYKGGYLRALLGLGSLIWNLSTGISSPFKMKNINYKFLSYRGPNLNENTLYNGFHNDGLHAIYAWAKKEIGNTGSYPLVKHILGLYLKDINKYGKEYKKIFKLSDDKINQILGELKELLNQFS